MKRLILLSGVLAIGIYGIQVSQVIQADNNELSLEMAVSIAQSNDLWLVANQHSQDATEAMSVVAGTLPDPKISMGVANLAADSLDFNQEPMTQFKVGVSQMFPRGDSRAIRQQQLTLMSSQYPYQRQDRQAKLAVIVSQHWLDAYKAKESVALIESNRGLFEQLTDVAQASYSSGLGRTRQQDIIRAQLELTRLDDRLTRLRQQQEMARQKLNEWLNNAFVESSLATPVTGLSRTLPDVVLLNAQLYTASDDGSTEELMGYFSRHPALKAMQQKIKASRSGIELARQKYKPAWGINAAFSYRGDTPSGGNRADLLSLGVTFDIPLFTAKRQDKELQSAVSKSAAMQTEEWLLLRKFMAAFEMNKTKLLRLNQRQILYKDRLLPQISEQAEASLTAYTNDDGDFSEVVRARIAELNAAIDALVIDVDRQKTIIQLNYFFDYHVGDK